MLILRLTPILFPTFLLILFSSSACFSWSGETWDTMTRDEICMIANEMIDSTWSPANDIQNYRSASGYTWFYAGTTYKGEAYMMWNPVDDWNEFLAHVNNTSGGITYYGNDCSAFVSICWKMTTRHTTSTIEGDSHVELLGAVGECGVVELIVGDACNDDGNHIVLFDYYDPLGNGIYTMEQTPETAQRLLRTWSELSTYRPLRRKDLESTAIPTLSEWKQIFLTLIMLSLVMGSVRKTHNTFVLPKGNTMLRITVANLLAFNKQLFCSVLKWVGIVVVLELTGATVIYGHVNMLDIIGTLFCAPLVAYILHLVISFMHDYEGISG
jgi:hypothetical protein